MNSPVPQILGAIFDPNSPFLFSSDFLASVLKTMFLVGFGLYGIFAFAVVRQTALMTRTLQTGANGALRLFSWAHLIVAILIWCIAFLVL